MTVGVGSGSGIGIGSGVNPRFLMACSLNSLVISFWIFISRRASGDGLGLILVAIPDV